jgi:hypothetical protein
MSSWYTSHPRFHIDNTEFCQDKAFRVLKCYLSAREFREQGTSDLYYLVVSRNAALQINSLPDNLIVVLRLDSLRTSRRLRGDTAHSRHLQYRTVAGWYT